MRFRLDALLKPADPVVATFRSSCDADHSLAVLRRAGFGHADLTVVGHAGVDTDHAFAMRLKRPGWGTSGAALGLLWAAFAATMAVLPPMGVAALAPLLAMAALTLGVQAAVMGRVLDPARERLQARPAIPPRNPADESTRADWRFHIVVHGSRSDIALAKALVTSR
jgi:hypothetical protein